MSTGGNQPTAPEVEAAVAAIAQGASPLTLALEETARKGFVEYIPLGQSAVVRLNVKQIQTHLANPTAKGIRPSVTDCLGFAMLCKAQGLDPWAGDAYLLGFDNKDDTATFQKITAYAALLKRAELSEQFDGLEGGIVIIKDGEMVDRKGALLMPNEEPYGAWAVVTRKDCKVPFAPRIKFATYDKGWSRWKVDPEGMIVKCAKAAALREAFPAQLGGLYVEGEMGADHTKDTDATAEAIAARAKELKNMAKQNAGDPQAVPPGPVPMEQLPTVGPKPKPAEQLTEDELERQAEHDRTMAEIGDMISACGSESQRKRLKEQIEAVLPTILKPSDKGKLQADLANREFQPNNPKGSKTR